MPIGHSREPRVLGSESFLAQMPAALRQPRLFLSLADLVERCCQHYNGSAQELI